MKNKVNFKGSAKKWLAGILTLSLCGGVVLSTLNTQVQAEENSSSLDGFRTVSVNDSGTSDLNSESFAGTAADDGKVWVDKTVSNGTVYGATAEDKNFNVVLSALAQTYSTPAVEFTTYKREISYDVVLALDMSASMRMGNTDRITPMVEAVNTTISTLMENSNNRVAIVMFPFKDENSAGTWLEMGHYTPGNNGKFLTSLGSTVSLASGVKKDGEKVSVSSVSTVTSTPTQLGFNAAYQAFENALENEAEVSSGDIPRVPVTILMSDGEPLYAENYKTSNGYFTGVKRDGRSWDYQTQQGNNDSASRYHKNNTNVAYNTIMTANHVKRKIQDLYDTKYDGEEELGKDLYTKAIQDYNKTKIGQIFTIGFDVPSNNWKSYVLNPESEIGNRYDNTSVVDRIVNRVTEDGIKTKLDKSEYANDKQGYSYSSQYLNGEGLDAEDLTNMFSTLLNSMVQQTNEYVVSNPLQNATGNVLGDVHDVTFTDYLGYKMEVKGDKQYVRYNGVNYTFTKTANSTDTNLEFTWNGTDMYGDRVSSPIEIVSEEKNGAISERGFSLYDVKLNVTWDEEAEVNGQKGYWKVTWTFPSPLLPTYNREEGFSTTRPIRLLFEVGLMDDVDPIKDALKLNEQGNLVKDGEKVTEYAFDTNLYDYGKDVEYANVSFEPGKENPYYYKTGYTTNGSGDRYVEVNFISQKAEDIVVTGNVSNIALTDIKVTNQNGTPSKLSFKYDGNTYSGDLSSITTGSVDEKDRRWKTSINIPVLWTYKEDGQPDKTITSTVKIDVTVLINSQNQTIISGLVANGIPATDLPSFEAHGGTLTQHTFEKEIPVSGKSGTTEGQVLTTTYTPLRQATGDLGEINAGEYYIQDSLNQNIKVKVEVDANGEKVNINLGGEEQVSDIYYKVANESNYPENGKQFGKGTNVVVYDSFVEVWLDEQQEPRGEFHPAPNNPSAAGKIFKLENIKETNLPGYSGVNQYYTADVTLQDPYGEDMTLTFTLRRIQVGDKYAVTLEEVKSSISESGLTWADHPTIVEADGYTKYKTDISFAHSSSDGKEDTGNITDTSDNYFEGHFNGGTMSGRLGNNGKISILAEDVTEFSVEKQWLDEENKPVTEGLPAEITVDLLQVNPNKPDETPRVMEEGVTITSDRGWKYTWDALPKYITNLDGSYELDNSGDKVVAQYTVQENPAIPGWTYSVSDASGESVSLTNKLTEIKNISLVKEFEDKHYEELEDKSNWTVEAKLYYGTDENKLVPYESKTVIEDPNRINVELSAIEWELDTPTSGTSILTVKHGDYTNAPKWSEKINITRSLGDDGSTQAIEIEKPNILLITPSDWSIGDKATHDYADKLTLNIELGTDSNSSNIKVSSISGVYQNSFIQGNEHTISINSEATKQENGNRQDIGLAGAKASNYVMSYTEGEVVSRLTADNEWKQDWELSLPQFDDAGNKLLYQFKEEVIIIEHNNHTDRFEVKDGFIEVSLDKEDPKAQTYRYKVTNSELTNDPDENGLLTFRISNEDDKVDLVAHKNWIGGEENKDYSTYVRVFTKGDNDVLTPIDINGIETVKGITGKEENGILFEGLNRYDNQGNEITYVLKEVASEESKEPINVDGTIVSNEDTFTLTDEKVSTDGKTYEFTNTRSGSKDLTITKIWKDAGNIENRPESLEIHLQRKLASEEPEKFSEVGVKTIYEPDYTETDVDKWVESENSANTWTYTWKGLPQFDDEGQAYEYRIQEKRITEVYHPPVHDGLTVTNTLAPGNVSIRFDKEWIDGNNEDSTRPDEITIRLQSRSVTTSDQVFKDVEGKTISLGKDKLSYTWENLAKYDADGNLIEYRVKEDVPKGYSASNNGIGVVKTANEEESVDGISTITNTRSDIDDTVSVSVTKQWTDTPDEFDIPEVKFDIYADNAKLEGKTLVVKEQNVTYAEKGLPKYNKTTGSRIEYTLEEQDIDVGEDAVILKAIGDDTDSSDNFAYTATNTYRVVSKDITVNKVWKGVSGNNIPESITVELSAATEDGEKEDLNGEEDGNSLIVIITPKDNKWEHKFNDLPVYLDVEDETTKLTYTVDETQIGDHNIKDTDYSVEITEPSDSGTEFTITNTLGGTLSGDLSGQKTWTNVDLSNRSEIEVQLYRTIDNKTYEAVENVAPVTVESQEDVWAFTFDDTKDLPKYDENGNKYTYVVKETKVGKETVNYGKDIDYATKGTVGGYTVILDGTNITNTLGETSALLRDITVKKSWLDKNGNSLETNLPDNITVELTGKVDGEAFDINSDPEKTTFVEVIDANDGWQHEFKGLPKFTEDGITPIEYSVKETKIGSEEVVDDKAGFYEVSINGTNITNKLTEDLTEKTTFAFTKQWVGVKGDNIPSIAVQLYQDGKEYGDPVTLTSTSEGVDVGENGNWTYEFKDLPKYSSNGMLKHVYTVKEVKVGENDVTETNPSTAGDYQVSQDGDVITNTLTGEYTEFKGRKIWKDEAKAEERPTDVYVGLYRYTTDPNQAKEVDKVQIQSDLTFEFKKEKGYEKYDENGTPYIYLIREMDESGLPISDGSVTKFGNNEYKVTYGKDADDPTVTTITNTLTGNYVPGVNPLKVTKHWLDNDNSENKRPVSITVRLIKNKGVAESITLTKDNAIHPDISQPVQPTLPEETQPEQPPVNEEETDITQSPETSEGVEEGAVVQDEQTSESSQDQVEPINEILERPVVEETQVVGENSNDWYGEFGIHPMYDENGSKIHYSVVEDTIENYTLTDDSPTGSAEEGWTLTNVYTPGQMSITINKKWVDNNNAEGTRPDSIDVVLVRSDGYETPVTLTAAANWTNTINVESTDPNGVMYSYSVREANKIGDYVASVDGYTITNTLTGTENVSGEKKWNNISEENRPKDVTIALYRQVDNNPVEVVVDANGNAVTAIVNKETEWKYNFGDLNKYDENGAKITYSVKETMVNGVPIEETDYASKVDGYNVENSIKEGLDLNIKGTKTWVDNDNEYKTRPLSIKVNLLANGKVVDTATVSEKTNWSYEFNDLPKYDMSNGALLTYTIDEETVGNYDKVINGFDIVNKLKDEAIPKPDPKPEDPKPEKPADPEKPSGGKDNANTATQTYAGMFVSMMTSAASLAGILAILKKRREI